MLPFGSHLKPVCVVNCWSCCLQERFSLNIKDQLARVRTRQYHWTLFFNINSGSVSQSMAWKSICTNLPVTESQNIEGYQSDCAKLISHLFANCKTGKIALNPSVQSVMCIVSCHNLRNHGNAPVIFLKQQRAWKCNTKLMRTKKYIILRSLSLAATCISSHVSFMLSSVRKRHS